MNETARGDVSEMARAELGSSFGARTQDVSYAVGTGTAEARGVNAVTIGGRVDFAPGMFDLDSLGGRARLGEETAHAMQQSNPGEHSSVNALEGEAKRAGQDFAAGHAPKVNLAAPAGLALADDGKDKDKADAAPKDTDPSAEVPDLQNAEVTALKKVLAADQAETLKQLLKALQRIDKAQFSTADLTGNKLDTKGGSSTTRQGPAFKAWLETYLDDVATKASKTRDKLTQDELKKAIKDAVPPLDKKDIEVKISTGAFSSLSLLYSTVRHEFVHVQQLRADYLAYIPDSLMPNGVSSPSYGKVGKDREVEAYLWEMENLAKTGLKDPSEIHLLWEQCSNAWLNSSAEATKKFKTRFEAAFKDVWQKAMDGHIVVIDVLYKDFKKSGSVADAAKVQTLHDDMEQMWNYRNNFNNNWSGHVASHTTALTQSKEMLAAVKAERLKKLLDEVDTELKSGYADADEAFSRWDDLTTPWTGLAATAQASLEARYKVTAPALWEKAFTMLEAEVRKRIKGKELEVAEEYIKNSIGDLFTKAGKSFVKAADFAKRRDDLKAEVRKAKAAP